MNLPSCAIKKLAALGLGDKLGDVLAIIADAEEPQTKRKAKPQQQLIELSDWPSDYESQFWNVAPRKVAKGYAVEVLERLKRGGKVEWKVLFAGWQRHAELVSTSEALSPITSPVSVS